MAIWWPRAGGGRELDLTIWYGRQGSRHAFTAVFHFDMRPDGNVWFRRNVTEYEVVGTLKGRCIASEDIVPGFLPEYVRQLARA